MELKISLALGKETQTVTVEAGADLVENTSTSHTDVDRGLFDKLPLESQSSELSSLVTISVPGIAADSNGLFHSFGDHASNSFSLDGQPITDQQSKVFSNQIPLDAVQSMEVIQGAPPAEYGDKTSLVINVTTRSGLGQTEPHGDVTASYGTFGTNRRPQWGTVSWPAESSLYTTPAPAAPPYSVVPYRLPAASRITGANGPDPSAPPAKLCSTV